MSIEKPIIIVSDTGPLIALAKTANLYILRELFAKVIVPPAVLQELKTPTSREGARALFEAIEKSRWIEVSGPVDVPMVLVRSLDKGEAEAVTLAKAKGLVLLIDEKKAARWQARKKVKVTGTGAVLVAAKKKGIIKKVSPIIDELMGCGYRIAESLQKKILTLAQE